LLPLGCSFQISIFKNDKSITSPNSSKDFLIFKPAIEATSPPAFPLPVRLTPFTASCSRISFTTLPYFKVLENPFRKPASKRTSSIAFPLPKQIEACFRTTVFPAKIAGTANLNTCQKGKFQGITPRITPLGA
jgi:hypothetical protein